MSTATNVSGLKLGTLAYIVQDNKILLLHRIKRKNDIHFGRWVGIGGKLEPHETPHDCIVREIKEEAGIIPTTIIFRGYVYFDEIKKEGQDVSPAYNWIVFLYKITDFIGEVLTENHEGVLKWIPIEKLHEYKMWEGDYHLIHAILKETKPLEAYFLYDGEMVVDFYFWPKKRQPNVNIP